MVQDLMVMEERHYDRMFDKYNEPAKCSERPDYNPKERRYALDNLLEFVEDDIEMLEDYSKSPSPEKQQVFREYEGLLGELRKYAQLLRTDRFDADCEYQKDPSYWDSKD